MSLRLSTCYTLASLTRVSSIRRRYSRYVNESGELIYTNSLELARKRVSPHSFQVVVVVAFTANATRSLLPFVVDIDIVAGSHIVDAYAHTQQHTYTLV